jgi:D-glycero-D-manno-heptose 1,7-bisphosphate phosphatase
MNKAVFLDRDGTIIEDVGYLNTPAAIKFLPGSLEAIKKLKEAGYKVVVITNQAGVARGLVTEDLLQTIDKVMHRLILNSGTHLDGIYYCPHHPEHGHYPYKQACECRKPHPGLIKRAQRDLKIDLAESFMVGDKTSDIKAGKTAGVKTVYVESGPHLEDRAQLSQNPPDHVAKNLHTAVEWILNGTH